MVAQRVFALIPLLHTTTGRTRALAIGYGTGMTARVLQDQGLKSWMWWVVARYRGWRINAFQIS